MQVSIILVSYNTKDLIRDCLKSVYEKTTDLDFDVYVVDNNSYDGSPEMIEQEFPQVKLVRNSENKGFGAANNIAIRQSDAKYVFCLNTDTILINNAVKLMYDYMENNPQVGACGGNLYHADMSPAYGGYDLHNVWNCSTIFWFSKFIFKKKYEPKEVKKEKEIGFVTGADLFMRKSALDKSGLFDENIFMYSEDVDLCKRISDLGYKITVIPEPKIIHLEGVSRTTLIKSKIKALPGKYYYLRKHKMYTTLYTMKISYLILHVFCYLFTFNPDHKELLKIHFNG